MGKNTESGGSEPHRTLTSGLLAGAAGKKADLVHMEMRFLLSLQRSSSIGFTSVKEWSTVAISVLRTLTQEDSRFKTSLATH